MNDVATVVVRKIQVRCEEGKQLMDLMYSEQRCNTYEVPGYHFPFYQCRSFAFEWWNYTLDKYWRE